MSLRIIGLFLVGLLLAPRIADACGVWHMQDKEKQVDIEWLINSGRVNRPNPKARPGSDDNATITFASLYLDTENKSGLRVVRERKIVFDVVGNKVRKFGKLVGTIDKDTIKFGSRSYTIEWGDKGTDHSMPSWKLTVKRGDTVVIEAPAASALCAVAHAMTTTGQAMPDDDQMTEIRTRIAFYLAWREVGDR